MLYVRSAHVAQEVTVVLTMAFIRDESSCDYTLNSSEDPISGKREWYPSGKVSSS